MPERWTSLDRVTAALEHREADRVPFDLGGSALTGMHRVAYRRLRSVLGLRELPIDIVDPVRQLARLHQDVVDLLRVDVRPVFPSPPSSPTLEAPVVEADGGHMFTDEWGVTWATSADSGLSFLARRHPLAEAETVADLESFAWPDPLAPARFDTLKASADRAVNEQKRAYILGRHAPGIFDLALRLRGPEHFLLDLAAQPRFAASLLDIITGLKMHYWEHALDTVGDNVLIVDEADDVEAARGPVLSPEMYARFIAPRHRQLFEFIKRRAHTKVHILYHSCGASKAFLPLLLEEGIDILNPVETGAGGMDAAELKRLYGRDLTIWGAGVDTGHVLPHGTPAEVRDEVRRRLEVLAPGGGFVFAPAHNVAADAPPENVIAMWEALQEFGACAPAEGA